MTIITNEDTWQLQFLRKIDEEFQFFRTLIALCSTTTTTTTTAATSISYK